MNAYGADKLSQFANDANNSNAASVSVSPNISPRTNDNVNKFLYPSNNNTYRHISMRSYDPDNDLIRRNHMKLPPNPKRSSHRNGNRNGNGNVHAPKHQYSKAHSGTL